jgi:hypothetical protein
VGEVVFAGDPPRIMGWAMYDQAPKPVWPLSSTWDGLGLLLDRMLSLGWNYDVDATAPELGIDVSFHPKNPAFRAKGTGATLPKAACIAAILSVQGPT